MGAKIQPHTMNPGTELLPRGRDIFFLEFSQVNPISAKGIHRPLKMV